MHTCTRRHLVNASNQNFIPNICARCGSVNKQYIKHFNGWKFTAIVLFTFKCSQYCLHSNVVFAVAYIQMQLCICKCKMLRLPCQKAFPHRIVCNTHIPDFMCHFGVCVCVCVCFRATRNLVSSAIDDCHVYHLKECATYKWSLFAYCVSIYMCIQMQMIVCLILLHMYEINYL